MLKLPRTLASLLATFGLLGGLLFAQSSAAAALKVLYSLGGSDGKQPSGGLVRDGAGNLYGTTQYLGANGAGTVFRLSPPAGGTGPWTYTVLYDFCPGGGSCTDGNSPVAGLILDVNGNLYGTTQKGGGGMSGTAYSGVVFKLSPPAGGGTPWNLTVMHAFCPALGCADGYKPLGRLTYSGASTGSLYNGLSALYSTTELGGANGDGTVFKIKPGALSGVWNHSVIYSFQNSADGADPLSGVIMDSAGALYGTAGGGTGGGGVVYELTNPGGGGAWSQTVLTSLYAHDPVGYGLASEVSMDGAGNLVGITSIGGTGFDPAGDGTIFSLPITGGTATPLYNFCTMGVAFNCTDGVPAGEDGYGPFVDTATGTIYGETQWGGGSGGGQGDGVVYKLTSGGAYTVLHSFCSRTACADGISPNGGLISDGSGNLYGVTLQGGTNNYGTIFRITP